MNPKKLLSVIVAAAVAVASASTLALTAYPTLLPLQTFDVETDISGYTDEQLRSIPASVVLDNLTYSRDYTVVVRENGEVSEIDPNQTAEADTTEVNTTAEADPAEKDPNTTSGAGANAVVKTVTYKKGDKVVYDQNAVKLWINGDVYQLNDENSTVNLKEYYSDDTYSTTLQFIVGSGKQLDPGNVIYNVNATVKREIFKPTYSYQFYKMVNGEKQYLAAPLKIDSNYDGSYVRIYLSYVAQNYYRDPLYIEVTGSLEKKNDDGTYSPCDSACEVEYYTDYSVDADNELPIYIMQRSTTVDFYARFTNANGDILLDDNVEVSVYTSGVYGGVWLTQDYDSVYFYKTDNSMANTFEISRGFVFDSEEKANAENTVMISMLGYYPGIPDADDSTNFISPDLTYGNRKYILKSVVGSYSSLEEVTDLADISEELFSTGYNGVFSGDGQTFTVFVDPAAVPLIIDKTGGDVSAYVIHIKVATLVEASEDPDPAPDPDPDVPETTLPVPDINNSYFRLRSVRSADDGYINYLLINNSFTNFKTGLTTKLDSYYSQNYQTALIYDPDGSVDMSKLKLNVDSTENSRISISSSGAEVKFNEMPQDFTNGPIQYTVAVKAGQGNYKVNIVKNTTGGAKLFVNGPSKREVFLDSFYGRTHDILVANIGDQELTGLNVVLSDAQNVKLDGYWVVGGEKNDTLAPFTTVNNSEMRNLAKIRLVPDGSGEISGKLTITADGQAPVEIELTGHAGNPTIVTNPNLQNGVKYVPYYSVIATDNIYKWNKETFSLSGKLPAGLSFNAKNGEITGIPQKPGKYSFYVKVEFSGTRNSVRQRFTIEVLDNTDENVYNATDEDYTLLTPIGSEQTSGKYDFRIANTNDDQLFVSNGTYGEFVDLWINGERMIPGEDYTSESGSTRITIKSQTLGKKLSSTTSNTIAAEFHVSGTTVVKRTAQNVSVGKITNGNKPNNNGGTGSVSGTHKPSEDLNIPSLNDPAVNDVVQKINDLPPVPRTDDAADIEAARKAYDSLTPDQKKLVYNLDKLTNAEEDLKNALPGTGKTDDGKDTTPADTDKKDDTTQPTTEAPVDPTETTEAPGESDVTSEATDEADVTAEATDESFGTTDATGEPEDSGYEQVVPAVKVFVFTFTDADRNPLEGLLVELHSTVQNGVSDENGSVEFTDVEFGDHTLYVTDPATGETVSIAFTLNESNSFVFSGDSVSAADGSEIDMNVVYDGESLVFADADFTPAAEDPTPATEDSTSGDPFSDNKGNPYTGIRTTAIFGLCASSAALMFILRPRKKNTK